VVRLVHLLLGIGNQLMGDDGAGNFVATRIRRPGWIAFDCGTAPENFTGKVKDLHPEILVLVDAADMKILPGEFRLVSPVHIADVAFGTHALSLRILIEYLAPYVNRILFIGIQPKRVEPGLSLSDAVKKSTGRLARLIELEEFDRIEEFIPVNQ
jgi:hydrogenase 3 maturation protease